MRRYYVSADLEKAGGMGHQEWLYFKTWDEQNKYLSRFFPECHNPAEHVEEPEPETWVFRYGKWKIEGIHRNLAHPEYYNEREQAFYKKNGYLKTYHDLSGQVSFGVRNYYYDWEF